MFDSDHSSLPQSEVVIPDVVRTVNLTGWMQTCQEFHLELNVKISGYYLKAKQQTEPGSTYIYPLDGAKITASEIFLRSFLHSY